MIDNLNYFLREFGSEIGIAILSSIITLFLLSRMKPKIKISKVITTNRNEDSFNIKIINSSYLFSYINVKAELQIVSNASDGLKHAKNIKLNKNYLFQIDKNKICNKEYDNAYRFSSSTRIKNMIRSKRESFKYLRFKIIATHSFTGFTSVKIVKYSENDIICGEFQVGGNFRIERFSH